MTNGHFLSFFRIWGIRCLVVGLALGGPPFAAGQSTQEIVKLLNDYKANPTPENAVKILKKSARVDQLRQAGQIPAEHANTLWDVDDFKVDALNRQIAEAGKVHGNKFQVSIYGSDSRRPPTRTQLQERFPGSPPELIEKQLEEARRLAGQKGYDVFRSDFDMTFTGPEAQAASREVLSGVSRELGQASPESIGLNGLSYPTVPGTGYDVRIKYIGNQEMYNSRAGIKWINRNMYENGLVTYWDADAGRMVTQRIREYTGKVPLPFKAPEPITEEELFGFLADNWNQMQHHLLNSENDAQRLKWIEKYLSRGLGEFPDSVLAKVGLSANERRLLEASRAAREAGDAAEIQRLKGEMFELYQNVMQRAHVAQIDLIAAQIEKNVKMGLDIAGDQKLRLMLQELAGSYKNFGIDRAQALLSDMARAVGKDSVIYKALFTALQQAKDLKDEADIMAKLEQLLKKTKGTNIVRPGEAGKPAEAKLEDPFQKHALDKGVQSNPGDPDFGDAAEFAKKYPNSGTVLQDKKIFSEQFRQDRLKSFEDIAASKLKALTPEEAEKWRLKFRGAARTHISNEIDQSWLARHKQWLQIPEEAKSTTLYTRSFFNELGSKVSRLEGATATIKGVVLRHKLISGIILISAAYGWYTNGAWGAAEAVWESGKAIAVFEVINWVCFTGAAMAAEYTGLAAIGPIGWAIGIIYNVYEIGKLAVLLGPVVVDLMNRAVDTIVFGSSSDLNAQRFYRGGTYKSFLTGEMQSPGFFDSLWNFNATERGAAKSEKDLFPVFATPDELRAAIEKEWTDGAVGQKWYYMFGNLTLEKMKALALADWQKSFTLKLNEFLQSLKSDKPKDDDIGRFEQTNAEANARKWTDLYGTTQGVILGLETRPSPPKPGAEVELACDYMVFGLPGQSLETRLVLKVLSPAGEAAEEEKTTSDFPEQAVTADERSKVVSIRKSIKLDDAFDVSRAKFVAELYDFNGKLLDTYEIAGDVQSTTIDVKTRRSGTDASANAWVLDIEVKDAGGTLVTEGDIKIETDKGLFEDGKSEGEGSLNKGAKSVVWTGPKDKAEKAKVKITYFGDERDPAKPDKKYAPCDKTIEMPPALIETKITVTTSPASPSDKAANDWTLEITIRDVDEKVVTTGFLAITADKGGLDEKGKSAWEGAVAGEPVKVKWIGPKDRKEKASVVVTYLGDEKDPAVPDKLYAESRTTLSLPPDALETKIEVQTSPVPPTGGAANDWKLDVLVKDANDKPVEMGEMKIEAADGGLERRDAKEWKGPLKGGKLQVTWFGPADKKKKVGIKLTYLGDESDPAVPDSVYRESETTTELPRALATEITWKAVPVPKEPKKWDIEIEVKDELGRKVDLGILEVEVSDGSVETATATKTGVDFADLKGRDKFKFPFFAPADPKKKAKFTVRYFGDQKDPAVPDDVFRDSDTTFQLPPELALTNIQVSTRKANPADPKNNDWIMELSVKEETGAFVASGDLKIECTEGALDTPGKMEWEGGLKEGKATVKWLGPDDPKKKAKVAVHYFGDQKDPALPDLKYQECDKTFSLPPKSLKPTTVNITASLTDEKKKIWKLEIEVSDDKGVPVSKGAVRYSATGGSFAEGKSVLDYQKELQAGKHIKGWKQTDDNQQTITVKYLGDEADPAKEDTVYEESQASIKLPPDALDKSTVFVIDASGSMQGAKLASAKEAVRAALAGYVGKDNKEEWALFAFFDCGNCTLLQGFTRDPGLVTSKLGFEASGSTPIAYSLRIASNYLRRAARGKTGRIILLSDGGENCSGKPVEEAKSIRVRTISVDLTK